MLPFPSGNQDGADRSNQPVPPQDNHPEEERFPLADEQPWQDQLDSESLLLQQQSALCYYSTGPPPPMYFQDTSLDALYQASPTTPTPPQHPMHPNTSAASFFPTWHYPDPSWGATLSTYSDNAAIHQGHASMPHAHDPAMLPLPNAMTTEQAPDRGHQKEELINTLVSMAREREKHAGPRVSDALPGPSRRQQRTMLDASSNDRRYELVIVQEPLRARMCGFGNKDRRHVSPPPILQLFVTDANHKRIDPEKLDVSFLVVLCDSWQADGTAEANLIRQHADRTLRDRENDGKITRNLIGSLVASATKLHDPGGQLGIYFIFHDLSIRLEGTYRLGFSLVDLSFAQRDHAANASHAPVLAKALTQPITVYSAKKFPGVIPSTELSKCFTKQGVKIPVRKESSSSKAKDDPQPEDEYDSEG